jgi:hypothetical protein
MKTAGVSKNCEEPEPAGQWSVRQQENEALEVPPALLDLNGLQEIEWVFLATSERWKHACEHLEPQIFLVA